MKIALKIVWAKPSDVVAFARAAEDLGYESVWSGEHVSLPTKPDWWKVFPLAEILGDEFTEEMVPFTPSSPFLDPMIVLAHVAAATTRVRLGIGIYMLTLRDAVLVGRTLASLDVLSGGASTWRRVWAGPPTSTSSPAMTGRRGASGATS